MKKFFAISAALLLCCGCFAFTGCSDQTKQDAQKLEQDVAADVENAVDAAKDKVEDAVDAAKEKAADAAANAADAANDAAANAADAASDALDAAADELK